MVHKFEVAFGRPQIKDMIEIISHPGPDRSVTIEGLKQYKVHSRRYRNRRIGDFLKELHLTEGRNTGFMKIIDALKKNGSPLPEFETDDNHDYFITRLFIREGFNDHENVVENVIENVVENVVEKLSGKIDVLFAGYSEKRKATALKILAIIGSDGHTTIFQISQKTGMNIRTVQRYLKEFQDNGILKREGSDINGEWILL